MPISLRIMIAIIFLSLGTVLWFGLDVVDTQFLEGFFFLLSRFFKVGCFLFPGKKIWGA